jgi:hypothetical protein
LMFAITMMILTSQKKKSLGAGGFTLAGLYKQKEVRRELRIVYDITNFLVRMHLAERRELCTAKIARKFVEKSQPREGPISESKIEKIWNRYRAVAPFIFAFYPEFYSPDPVTAKPTIESEEDWIRCVARLADKSILDERFGYAAFVADLLKEGGKVRDVRQKEFNSVPRVMPSFQPFDESEEAIIKSFVE